MKISEITTVSDVLNYRNEGYTFKQIGAVYGVDEHCIINFLHRSGIHSTRDTLRAKLSYFGYTKAEAKTAHRHYKKDPTINLLDYLDCKCSDKVICLPCRLNRLREKYLLKSQV